MSSDVVASEPLDDEAWLVMLIASLDGHSQSLRAMGETGPVVAMLARTRDLASELLEKWREDLDQAEDWEHLYSQQDALGQALTEFGQRRWASRGPTRSYRLNRFFASFDSLDSETARQSLAQQIEDLLVAARQLLPDAAPLLPMLRQLCNHLDQVESSQELAREIFEVVLWLEQNHDLAAFDRPLVLDWAEGFSRLAQAVSRQTADVELLLEARDRMLLKLAGLADRVRQQPPSPDPTPRLVSLAEHLTTLEAHLETGDLEPWGQQLNGLWSSLDEWVSSFAEARPKCPVCSASVPSGALRCGGCRTLQTPR